MVDEFGMRLRDTSNANEQLENTYILIALLSFRIFRIGRLCLKKKLQIN